MAVTKVRFGLTDKVTDLFLSRCVNHETFRRLINVEVGQSERSVSLTLSHHGFKMPLVADEAQNSSCFSCFATFIKSSKQQCDPYI